MSKVFTPEEDEYYRARLISEYDRLIRHFEQAFERRGETFHMWFTEEEGKLTIAALKRARDLQIERSEK